jgi:3-methyladenine DNA glycosylase AlkD
MLQEILKEIKRNQNGPVSEAMTRMGLIYEQNYGISIVKLKEIAQTYGTNRQTAKELANMNIRETKILAYMINEPDKLNREDIKQIFLSIENHELAEQACTQLLDKTDIPEKELINFLKSDKEFTVTAVYILYARYAQFKTGYENEFFESCLNSVNHHISSDSIHIQKAMARALRTIALRNEYLKEKVIGILNTLNDEPNQSIKLITTEVLPYLD